MAMYERVMRSAKAAVKKAAKAMDKLFNEKYRMHASGAAFDIFDLSKIDSEFRASILAGGNPDDVMVALVAKYRKN